MYAVRELIYIGVRKNKSGVFEKYNRLFLQQNKFDVLFLGSSRAETHFNPQQFDSITGLNSYNMGITGATPRIAFGVLKAYCQKSTIPKYMVFDIDYHFIKYGVDTVKYFPRFFPYLKNKTLLEQFNNIDQRFVSFKYNPLHSLPYSGIGLLSASIHGWLGREGKYDPYYYKGYQKTIFHDTLTTTDITPDYTWFNPLERVYLDSIINFAGINKINLLLVTSPMFEGGNIEVKNKKQIIAQLKNIASLNRLIYKDFSDSYYTNRRNCFTDYYHLTHRGSVLFTAEFSQFFKQYFINKSVN